MFLLRRKHKTSWVIPLLLLFNLALALPMYGQNATPQIGAESLQTERVPADVGNPVAVSRKPVVNGVGPRDLAFDLDADPARVFMIEHNIQVGSGRFMRVQEFFTRQALMRSPRRGLLMLGSSAFNRRSFSIPVDGYNATEMFAKMGMLVFTLDYLGIGDSHHPENGRDVTREDTIAAMQRVIQLFRGARQIPKLDILAEGYGSTLVPYLAADTSSIRKVVMSSTIYKYLAGGPLTDKAFVEAIENDEDGYVAVPAEAYDSVMPGAPAGVLQHFRATQPGLYPITFLPAATTFPFFDPGVARAPGLVIYGRDDIFAGPGDPEALAADYGTQGAELVFLDGAGHAPRVEGPENAARFWAEVIRFIEP